MIKSIIFFSVLCINFSYAQTRDAFNNLNIKEDSVLVSSDPQLSTDRLLIISKIDTLIKTHPEKAEVLALVDLARPPVKVLKDKWPAGVMVSINILRDTKGKIIYYAEFPKSESGDWFIGYHYYFDETGNTLAFKRVASFFNSECSASVVLEQSLYFFKIDLSLIEKQYKLSDKSGNDLKKNLCYFPYDYPYVIKSNNQDLLK